jgi:hypothetical protein
MWALGCSCGSDPNVQKNPPPPGPDSGTSVGCSCSNLKVSYPGGSKTLDSISETVCLPADSNGNPVDAAAYCADTFSEYVKSSALMLATRLSGDACGNVTITVGDCVNSPASHADPVCQGTCPSTACDTNNCSTDQLEAGTCSCSVPAACGGFGANAVCSPDALPPSSSTSTQQGALTVLVSHPGTWDHGTSSLKVSATVQVVCTPFGCLTASDTETTPASGSFQLLGTPCPGASCSVGLASQIQVDDFTMTFSVAFVSESANPRNIQVFARAPVGSISVGPDGHGVIPAGTLSVEASADEGSDHWVANKTNEDDVPVFIDWTAHTVQIQNFAVDFPDGSGIVNLNGSFGPSLNDGLESQDTDGDGVPDIHDNCVDVPNPDQHVVPNPVISVPSNTSSCQEPVAGSATAKDVCNGLPVTLTSDAPANFPPGATTVHWTATDAFGNKTTAVQLVEQQPSIVANKGILVDDRAITAATGAIPALVALGSQGVKIGVQAVVGEVSSVGPIALGDRSTALGTLVSQGAITRGSGVVTGITQPFSTVVTGSFPDFNHPAVVTGTTDVVVAVNQTRSLTPGRYRALTVYSGAKLTLAPGVYSFTNVDFEPQSTLSLSGATELDMTGTLIWRGAESLGSGAALPTLFYAGTSQIVLETNGSLHLIAPHASVALGSGSSLSFSGTIAADSVELRPAVTFACQPEAI